MNIKTRRQRGTTTVEFAIVATVLFTVLFGVIEVGRALFVWNTLTEATRRGARVAAVCPVNHASVARVAVFGEPLAGDASPILSNLRTANVQVDYLDETGTSTAIFEDIRYVRVGITNYQHRLIIPFLTTTITAPPFTTTLPAESLGIIPELGVRQCYGV
jgi:Flp pilus assembly protein TadG